MILPTFIQKILEYQEIYATLILHDKIKESGDCSMSGLFRALHRTKVFRNLTEQEFAWVLYDVGNSAFIMLACSLIPIWFKSLAIGTGPGKISSDQATAYYSIAISIVTVVVALIGPVCGVLADRKDKKRSFYHNGRSWHHRMCAEWRCNELGAVSGHLYCDKSLL